MNDKTAEQFQQDVANLYGVGNHVLWDLYHTKEKTYLKDKIELLLPGDDCDSLSFFDPNREKILRKNEKLDRIRKEMTEAIWNQRKYNERSLISSIIFVLHTPIIDNVSSALFKKNYTIYPVFRVRKCEKNNDSKNCCMIFVDEYSRVYQNWTDYISNNKLEKGIIVTPKDGIYTLDSKDKVNLSIFLTPEASPKNEALKIVDHTATGIAVTAAVGLSATVIFPPLAILTIPSVIIGSIAGSWGIGRSSAYLADRGIHEQSIGLDDREARSSWLNIGVGVVGLGASATTGVLQAYSAAGRTVPKALTLGMNGLSIATSGVSVGNCVSDLILKSLDGEDITSHDILALSAALFVFTHSIYNIHLTNKALAASENQGISFFKRFIGMEQNIRFDTYSTVGCVFETGKIIKKIVNLCGDTIRPLNKIPHNQNSSQVLECLEKILSDSKENVNNIRQKRSTNSSRTNAQYIERGSIKIKSGTNKIDTLVINHVIGIILDLIKNQKVARFGSMVDATLNIIEDVGELVLWKLIDMAKSLGSEILTAFSNNRKIEYPFENFLWEVYNAAKSIRVGGIITVEFLVNYSGQIYRYIRDYFKSCRPRTSGKQQCNQCGGFYTITPL